MDAVPVKLDCFILAINFFQGAISGKHIPLVTFVCHDLPLFVYHSLCEPQLVTMSKFRTLN